MLAIYAKQHVLLEFAGLDFRPERVGILELFCVLDFAENEFQNWTTWKMLPVGDACLLYVLYYASVTFLLPLCLAKQIYVHLSIF